MKKILILFQNQKLFNVFNIVYFDYLMKNIFQ